MIAITMKGAAFWKSHLRRIRLSALAATPTMTRTTKPTISWMA